jgi:aminopeptidase N
VDVDAVLAAHNHLKSALARELAQDWQALLDDQGKAEPYRFEPRAVARRRISALCLDYLATTDAPGIRETCYARFEQADNMTDCMAALTALRDIDCEERDNALAEFESRWYDDALVLDKWFSLQATSRLPGTLTHVKKLMDHDRFSLKNPNRVRALLGGFARGNLTRFHATDGSGYAFVAEQVRRLDGLNPQVAARMAGVFSRWRRFGERGQMMRDQLRYIAASDGLSGDVYEIVTKSLEEASKPAA